MNLNASKLLFRPGAAAAGIYAANLVGPQIDKILPGPAWLPSLAVGAIGVMLDSLPNPTIRSAGVAMGGVAILQLVGSILPKKTEGGAS